MDRWKNLDISAPRACTIHINDLKYYVWLSTHQQIYGPHRPAYMPSETSINITVQANGVEGGAIDILAVPYDPNLRQNLISTEYARLTRGNILRIESTISIQDRQGNVYVSCSYINLKWWRCGDTVSYKDDFYITEDLPRHRSAMLRGRPDGADDDKKALPLYLKVETPDEKRRAEDRSKHENSVQNAIRQAEDQKVKDRIRNAASPTSKKSTRHA